MKSWRPLWIISETFSFHMKKGTLIIIRTTGWKHDAALLQFLKRCVSGGGRFPVASLQIAMRFILPLTYSVRTVHTYLC